MTEGMVGAGQRSSKAAWVRAATPRLSGLLVVDPARWKLSATKIKHSELHLNDGNDEIISHEHYASAAASVQ